MEEMTSDEAKELLKKEKQLEQREQKLAKARAQKFIYNI